MVASQNVQIPIINAGDGGHQHPTQTLTDLLTIRSLKAVSYTHLDVYKRQAFQRVADGEIAAAQDFG